MDGAAYNVSEYNCKRDSYFARYETLAATIGSRRVLTIVDRRMLITNLYKDTLQERVSEARGVDGFKAASGIHVIGRNQLAACRVRNLIDAQVHSE